MPFHYKNLVITQLLDCVSKVNDPSFTSTWTDPVIDYHLSNTWLSDDITTSNKFFLPDPNNDCVISSGSCSLIGVDGNGDCDSMPLGSSHISISTTAPNANKIEAS